jgi:uncharacterized cupin superfamily protein
LSGIVRIEPSSVEDQPEVQEGPALTRTVTAFAPGQALEAGIWEAKAHTEHIPSQTCDEVCVIIEGTVHLRMPDGVEHAFGPGDAFAIEQGTELTWHQDDTVRKVFVTRER